MYSTSSHSKDWSYTDKSKGSSSEKSNSSSTSGDKFVKKSECSCLSQSNIVLYLLIYSALRGPRLIPPYFAEKACSAYSPSKKAEVIPLYKGTERDLCMNYRPILLLLTISKILEKIMYKRTYEFLDGNNQFYNSQYGFRSKHSCEIAICKLVGHVVKGHEKKRTYCCNILRFIKGV